MIGKPQIILKICACSHNLGKYASHNATKIQRYIKEGSDLFPDKFFVLPHNELIVPGSRVKRGATYLFFIWFHGKIFFLIDVILVGTY
jgi:hypothetical protein